jgi:hypothetical protein
MARYYRMATEMGEGEIDWEKIRISIQPAVDQQVARSVNMAQMSMLLALGNQRLGGNQPIAF